LAFLYAFLTLLQGYIVACPVVFHEFTGAAPLAYDVPGTDAGNSYKIKKLLSAYDEDAEKTVDLLVAHKNCTGRIGATGMCLGGHLAFRVSCFVLRFRVGM
jgi:carboxymethylenebutenolidase